LDPVAPARKFTTLDLTYGPDFETAAPALRRDTTLQRVSRDGESEGQQPTTFGVSQQGTFNYPAVLPALTAEQQALLASRRRLATRGFEETQAQVGRERARAEAEATRQRSEVARAQELQSRAGMQSLAGRGVARGPMFVNPFQRQLAEQSQRQVGELQSGLANTLAQLEGALRQSEIARDRELAQIDFDAASFRSDVGRLLGA